MKQLFEVRVSKFSGCIVTCSDYWCCLGLIRKHLNQGNAHFRIVCQIRDRFKTFQTSDSYNLFVLTYPQTQKVPHESFYEVNIVQYRIRLDFAYPLRFLTYTLGYATPGWEPLIQTQKCKMSMFPECLENAHSEKL